MRNVAIAIMLAALAVGCGDDDQGDEPEAPAISAECRAAAEAAAAETDSSRAEPLIAETLQACTSREEWLAVVEENPGVLGLTEDAPITDQDLKLACYRYADAPACQDVG